jgi:hypothetical protein
MSSIEGIALGAGGSVQLGRHASVEGITIVDASNASADSTINMASVIRDVTVHLGSNDDTVDTGRTRDTVTIKSGDLTSADNIRLGLGEDTLNIIDDIFYSDISAFTNVLNIENLKLSGQGSNQEVVMTGTAFEELDARDMQGGSITVDMTSQTTITEVFLGAGDDTVEIALADLTTDMKTINAGRGEDTLKITGASYNDANFASRAISNFEKVELAGTFNDAGTNFFTTGIDHIVAGAGLTLNTTAVNRGLTVEGSADADAFTLGARNDFIYGSAGADSVNAGAGDDRFYFTDAQMTATTTLNGGDGTDYVIFQDAVTLANTDLAGFSNVERIEFGNFASQTYEFGANSSDVVYLDANDVEHDITITKSTAASSIDYDGGSEIDTFIVSATNNLLATDRIEGNAGEDVLEFALGATITDDKLTNITEFEVIQLANAANSLTLGAEFQGAGFEKILTTSGSTLNNTIDMSAVTLRKGYEIVGADGVETISMRSTVFDFGVTITGNGGADILEITDRANITSDAFDNVIGIETLKLSNFVNNIVNLSDNANIDTIDASAITNGSLSVYMTEWTGDKDITINNANSTSIDRFEMNTAHLSDADTITAGADGDGVIDVLELSGTGTLLDAAFTNINSIETLYLNNNADYTITFDTNANDSGNGINYVDGRALLTDDVLTLDASAYTSKLKIDSGDGDDVLSTGLGNDTINGDNGDDVISSGSGDDYLRGGNGDDRFEFSSVDDLSQADNIDGQGGTDTLKFTDSGTNYADFTSDTMFNAVRGIEKLELDLDTTAGTFNVIEINTDMINASIREIDGSASSGDLEIDGSGAAAFVNLTMVGGAGDDKILAGNGNDKMTGNGGSDTFVFDFNANQNGTNTIYDFTADGTDKIAFTFTNGSLDDNNVARSTDGGEISLSDLNNYVESWYTDNAVIDHDNDDSTADQATDFTLITLTGGDTISLIGVDAADITKADFAYNLV